MRGRFRDRMFHWCVMGAALCVPGIALAGPEVPPTTAEVIQSVTDVWYPAMPTTFTAIAGLLVVFWAYRTIKAYIGRRTQHA